MRDLIIALLVRYSLGVGQRQLWLLLATSLAGSVAGAREPITLAILPSATVSGSKMDHWRYTICLLLKSQLRVRSEVCILADSSLEFGPDNSVNFGWSQVASLKLSDGERARKMGQLIEAERVIWLGYECDEQKCSLTAEIINVSTGKTSKFLEASDTNWFAVVCQMRNHILGELGVRPTAEELKRMDHPLTTSPAALELLSKALSDANAAKPRAEVVAKVNQAISLDPQFAMAHEVLAVTLLAEERGDEAAQVAKRAIALNPDSPRAHFLLGMAFRLEGLKSLSREQLLEAERLDPLEPEILRQLGALYYQEGHLDDAISALRKAEKLGPYLALVHADLALYLIERGIPDEALDELRATEHFNIDNDGWAILQLAKGYALMHDTPKAVQYYERVQAAVERVGLQSPEVENAKTALAELKPRLKPNFIAAPRPKTVTAGELEATLKAKLARDEYPLVTNPFAGSPEITAWGKQLVGDATNEMVKAQRLFDGLSRHIAQGFRSGESAAQQAFRDWSDPKARLSCQDYTFLFVALARSVGLSAHYVLVNEDYRGRFVLHTCAGVFVGEKALLVDPVYEWFGVPHQDFQFEDDLRAIVLFLAQSADIKQRKLAVKLAPNWAVPHFLSAFNSAVTPETKAAREELEAGLKIDRTSWLALFVQGGVELYGGRGGVALDCFEKCRRMEVDLPSLRYYLAAALAAEGKLKEAREEYRVYLQGDTDPGLANTAREAIIKINDAIGTGDSAQSIGLRDHGTSK